MASTTFDSYSLADLEALEREHPEFGRVEILSGTLVAAGANVTGDRHQAVVQAVFLALVADAPPDQVVRLDTYWFSVDQRLRPDLAIWSADDRPADGGAFTRPPLAVFEILSADADHDLVRKATIHRRHDVANWFVDPAERHGWWLSDGADISVTADSAAVDLPDRTSVTLDRQIIHA